MEDNPRPNNFASLNARRTPQERSAAAKRAGLASGKARRKRQSMREDALAILGAVVAKKELINALEQLGILDASPTIRKAILAGQVISAIKGNTRAAEFIRDTCGEKPVERIEQIGEMPDIRIGIIPDKFIRRNRKDKEA